MPVSPTEIIKQGLEARGRLDFKGINREKSKKESRRAHKGERDPAVSGGQTKQRQQREQKGKDKRRRTPTKERAKTQEEAAAATINQEQIEMTSLMKAEHRKH